MSEERIFNTITQYDQSTNGVVSLPIRPNQGSQYGSPGLSGKELQARFDKLAGLVISKYNEMAEALSGKDALEYFRLPENMDLPGDAANNLKALLNHLLNDDGSIKATDPTDNTEKNLDAVLLVLDSLIDTVDLRITNDVLKEGTGAIDDRINKHNHSTLAHSEIISAHNVAAGTHNDIRQAIVKEASDRDTAVRGVLAKYEELRPVVADLKAVVDNFFSTVSDGNNDPVDRLAEIVYYLDENRDLINELRDDRISKSSIVTNLKIQPVDDTKVPSAKLLQDIVDTLVTKDEVSGFVKESALSNYLTKSEGENYIDQGELNKALSNAAITWKYFLTAYEATEDVINGWVGKSDNWTISANQSVSGLKANDLIIFRCYNTSKESYSYALTRLNSVPSATVLNVYTTSVIHTPAVESGSSGIDISQIVTSLDDPSEVKVLSAATGQLIKDYVEQLRSNVQYVEMSGFISDSWLDYLIGKEFIIVYDEFPEFIGVKAGDLLIVKTTVESIPLPDLTVYKEKYLLGRVKSETETGIIAVIDGDILGGDINTIDNLISKEIQAIRDEFDNEFDRRPTTSDLQQILGNYAVPDNRSLVMDGAVTSAKGVFTVDANVHEDAPLRFFIGKQSEFAALHDTYNVLGLFTDDPDTNAYQTLADAVEDILDGDVAVEKAKCDEKGNPIFETYATAGALGNATKTIDNIINGDTIVAKAWKDGNGKYFDQQYATKDELNANKTAVNSALSNKADKSELSNYVDETELNNALAPYAKKDEVNTGIKRLNIKDNIYSTNWDALLYRYQSMLNVTLEPQRIIGVTGTISATNPFTEIGGTITAPFACTINQYSSSNRWYFGDMRVMPVDDGMNFYFAGVKIWIMPQTILISATLRHNDETLDIEGIGNLAFTDLNIYYE